MIQSEEINAPLTVSQLSAEIRDRVRTMGTVLFKGEVSGRRCNSKGCYSFDIKDGESAIRAWIWDRDALRMAVLPEDGQQYIFRARCDYWRTGNLMLIVDQVRYDDVGKLRAQLEALKRQLESEGAFRPERKRPLPFLPRAIALITSPTGAVIHDLQETILERYPNSEILVYPAQVQGLASPTSVVAALEQCNREARAEVAVIARGGGSFEELYAFNTEPVARAILNSKLPVVTALGHTSDRTLADLVADCECRTPTAAGERVVPRKADLLTQLAQRQQRLEREVDHLWGIRLERLENRQSRLAQLLPLLLGRRAERLTLCRAQIAQLHPERQLTHRGEQLEERGRRLKNTLGHTLRQIEEQIAARDHRLRALSPQAVLSRGYSITSDELSGTVLRQATSTSKGQRVKIRLASGQLKAQIQENS